MGKELIVRRSFFERREPEPTGMATVGGNELDAAINRLVPGLIKPKPASFIFLALCSVERLPFFVMSERHDFQLRAYAVARKAPADLIKAGSLEQMGHFSFEWSRYPGCAYCGAGGNNEPVFWWSTHCKTCKGKFHCHGSMKTGQNTCVCGTIHSSKSRVQETAPVVGLLPTINVF